jgi:acyl-coenzyme A synthetase/AMP-(fatty) acid ligase
VTLVGRTDHVINSGGVKIHAEEVEQALMRHPMVRQAGVVGVADPVWGQRVRLLWSRRQAPNRSRSSIGAAARTRCRR